MTAPRLNREGTGAQNPNVFEAQTANPSDAPRPAQQRVPGPLKPEQPGSGPIDTLRRLDTQARQTSVAFHHQG